jgi:hypothetical protein
MSSPWRTSSTSRLSSGPGGVDRRDATCLNRSNVSCGEAPRGANAPDALPRHERRLEAEVAEQYGPDRRLADVSEAWRPYRTWAAVHLRARREQRTHEMSGRPPTVT